MANHLRRSINDPIRDGLTTDQRWLGPDRGLIWCWERGRQKRVEEPDLAARADRGELVPLAWRGGIEDKLKVERYSGSLQYLATWQGLRDDDLDIVLDEEQEIICSRTGQMVVFRSKASAEE